MFEAASVLFFYTFLKNVQIIKGEERFPPQEKPIEAEVAITAKGSPASPQAPEEPTSLPGTQKDGGYGTGSQRYPYGTAVTGAPGGVLARGGVRLHRSNLQ